MGVHGLGRGRGRGHGVPSRRRRDAPGSGSATVSHSSLAWQTICRARESSIDCPS
ncbi:hypothetical protein FM106_25340 [Brachybacterium faecium]|nr:hypothetical protein FM106_25340 [Brachybacterium faecium]